MNFILKYIVIVLHAKCDILCFRFIFCSNFGNVIQTKILSFTNRITMHGRLADSVPGSGGCFKSASHKESLSLWNTAIWKIIEWWLGGRNASLRNYTTISLAFTTSVKHVSDREGEGGGISINSQGYVICKVAGLPPCTAESGYIGTLWWRIPRAFPWSAFPLWFSMKSASKAFSKTCFLWRTP